jgi:hypothetical protein
MLKAAYTMAYRDAKKRDGLLLQRVGASDFDAAGLTQLAHGNIETVINPNGRAAAWRAQRWPQAQQGQQGQPGQAPQQSDASLTRMAELLTELGDATQAIQQQLIQTQQELARVSAEVSQLRQMMDAQSPAPQQQTPAPTQENSGQNNTGPENAQAAPEAGEQPPTPPQQPVAEQGDGQQAPAAVDPAAVDPAAVDPAAAAVDPAAVDPTDLGPDPDAPAEPAALESGDDEVELASEEEREATNQEWVGAAAGETTPSIPEADGEVEQETAEPAAAAAEAPEQGTATAPAPKAPEQGTTTAPAQPASQAADQGVGPDDTDTRATQGESHAALDPDVAAAAKVGLDSPPAQPSTAKAAAQTANESSPATTGKAGPGQAATKENKTER